MEIKKKEGAFYIGDEKQPIAILEYRPCGKGRVEAFHTVVGEELQGQGIAGKLFKEFISFVKEKDLEVVPTCSYIDKKMNDDKELHQYICKK